MVEAGAQAPGGSMKSGLSAKSCAFWWPRPKRRWRPGQTLARWFCREQSLRPDAESFLFAGDSAVN